MVNAWKIGGGTGLLVLGVYIMFNYQEIPLIIVGIASIAIGIGLIASE